MPHRRGILLLTVPLLFAALASGCGEVRYAAAPDGNADDGRSDATADTIAKDLLHLTDLANACQGAPWVDGFEPNEQCGDPKPHYEISDKSNLKLTITGTLYPLGDVDWFRITVTESNVPGCLPLQSQCLYLDASLEAPPGLQYQYTIYKEACSDPTKTITSLGTATLRWGGECFVDDSLDAWIKVEAVAGAQPACSGQPYKLRFVERRENEGC